MVAQNEIKLQMIKIVQEIYQEIHPCSNQSELNESFTTEENILVFWFNTKDESTHVVSMHLSKNTV